MGSVAGAFNLNLRLSAYESTGQVRILSSPRITTMDNIEANIEQGVSIPVSTVSAMGAQTQFVDAKLEPRRSSRTSPTRAPSRSSST